MTTTDTPTRHARNRAAPRIDWRASGACSRVDPELFFPVGENKEAREQAETAKWICRRCPVVSQCLEWALETRQDVGVLGGKTEAERFAIHRRRGPGYWARRRDVATFMYENRRDEFLELLEQGLDAKEIAKAMGTNVQTVNRLTELLKADEAAQEVSV
jgi:WhiB family redox-sensing transcriptional regulator